MPQTTLKINLPEEEISYLKSIINELKTQDNLATSHPVYVVYEIERVPTDSEYDYDGTEYKTEDDIYETYDEAQNSILETHEDDEDFDESDVDDMIEEVYYIEKPSFLASFLTRDQAQGFIDRRPYAYHKPYIYVESGYYNTETQFIRKLLMESTIN